MNTPDALKQLALVVQKRKDAGYRSHHLFLTRCLPEDDMKEGYQALARLMHEGYFSTVLTSSTSEALEVALEEQRSPQYKVFVVGDTPDEQIAAAIKGLESGIHIVKLFNHGPQIAEALFLSKLSSEIQVSLKYYFNQSIIIVGCIDQKEESFFALRSNKDKVIYYVVQNFPSPDDAVVRYLHQQDNQLEDFLVTGNYGEFNRFFSALEKKIKDRPAENQAVVTKPLPSLDGSFLRSLHDHSDNNIFIDKKIKIFYICSYSEEDLQLQHKIKKHLGSLREHQPISEWHSGELNAGVEREIETRKHLEEAQIILLLVSADLFDSEDYHLVTRAMERHTAGNTMVIPIILRPTDWRKTAFGKLKALPDDQRPITSWSSRQDEALLNVAQGVRRAIEDLVKKGPAPFER